MLLSRVRRTIRERRLLPDGGVVVVACSGGPDSAVLLDVLVKLRAELGLSLVAASVDHQLRAGSAADVRVAGSLASLRGVPFRALAVHVPREGASLQARARTARYAALATLAAELGATTIAVGHTRDDQAETVLARLLHGAGPRGLAGIAPRRADGVVRPLLDCRRVDVHAWAARHALPFVTDPSNEDRRFLRVRIRQTVLPALAVEDPEIVPHLADLADDLREQAGVVARRAKRVLVVARRQEVREDETEEKKPRGEGADPLALACLVRLDRPTLREVLRAHLAAQGVRATRAHIVAIDELVRAGRGEVRLPGDRVVCIEDGALVVKVAAPLTHRARGPRLSKNDTRP